MNDYISHYNSQYMAAGFPQCPSREIDPRQYQNNYNNNISANYSYQHKPDQNSHIKADHATTAIAHLASVDRLVSATQKTIKLVSSLQQARAATRQSHAFTKLSPTLTPKDSSSNIAALHYYGYENAGDNTQNEIENLTDSTLNVIMESLESALESELSSRQPFVAHSYVKNSMNALPAQYEGETFENEQTVNLVSQLDVLARSTNNANQYHQHSNGGYKSPIEPHNDMDDLKEIESMFNDIRAFGEDTKPSTPPLRKLNFIAPIESSPNQLSTSPSSSCNEKYYFDYKNANGEQDDSAVSCSSGSSSTNKRYNFTTVKNNFDNSNQQVYQNVHPISPVSSTSEKKHQTETSQRTCPSKNNQRDILEMMGLNESSINAIEALALQFERQIQTMDHHSKKNQSPVVSQDHAHVNNLHGQCPEVDISCRDVYTSETPSVQYDMNINKIPIIVNNMNNDNIQSLDSTPQQRIVMQRSSQAIMVSDFKHLNPRACNEFYLSGTGCKNPPGTCQYSHDYYFTPQQLKKYRDYVKLMPCKIKNCKKTHATCLQAHLCPKGQTCKDKSKCLFLEH